MRIFAKPNYDKKERRKVSMATITLNYNARNSKALKLLEYIRSLDFIKIEEESYDDDFVKKIEQSRKEVREGKSVAINPDDLWK